MAQKDWSACWIFANGEIPDLQKLSRHIKPEARVIAADGGMHWCIALNFPVDVVIGDLDSISSSNKDELQQNKTEVIQYSSEKDETDLELALKLALERGSDWIRVAGALGGRVDHSLANISLLSHPMLNGLDCRFDDGVVEVTLIIDEDIITGNPGDLVSLLPWGGDCSEVRTSGLQYWLNNETLYPGSSRGVSNTLIEPAAKISLAKGRLLCIHTRLS